MLLDQDSPASRSRRALQSAVLLIASCFTLSLVAVLASPSIFKLADFQLRKPLLQALFPQTLAPLADSGGDVPVPAPQTLAPIADSGGDVPVPQTLAPLADSGDDVPAPTTLAPISHSDDDAVAVAPITLAPIEADDITMKAPVTLAPISHNDGDEAVGPVTLAPITAKDDRPKDDKLSSAGREDSQQLVDMGVHVFTAVPAVSDPAGTNNGGVYSLAPSQPAQQMDDSRPEYDELSALGDEGDERARIQGLGELSTDNTSCVACLHCLDTTMTPAQLSALGLGACPAAAGAYQACFTAFWPCRGLCAEACSAA